MSKILATLGNALSYGGMVTAIGLLVVFFGLALLIVILMLMARFFKALDRFQQERAEKKQAPQETKAQPEVAPVETVEAEEVVDDTELIAVIAAAIAAYEPDGKRLVVRRVRRVGGWNRAAREEQIGRF